MEEVDTALESEKRKNLIKNNRRIIKEGIINCWQERWDNETKGRVTYGFVKKVDMLVKSDWIYLSYETSCFLSGHGFFKAKLTELGLEDDPMCECGELQTSNHVLVQCRLLEEEKSSVLGGHVPESMDWFLKEEKNFEKLKELTCLIFAVRRRDVQG